jgi:ATP-dependent exoDNAse (exonuclease V) alpha subunit
VKENIVSKGMVADRDIFVIDDTGMVGSRQLGRVLEEVKAAGAKVVVVGDTEQLQAIEADAPMRTGG